ncbi:hypothetical protein [uncultured Bilophila sp.]|uniref:hypothetical protein n=1 Tax=uncultured Bilophila sp. TaxID=529385 RepID=UPI0026707C77|nr:hypothetical protein [uncultured Bilophila sp.]
MIPPQTEQITGHALTAGRSLIFSPQVEQNLNRPMTSPLLIMSPFKRNRYRAGSQRSGDAS